MITTKEKPPSFIGSTQQEVLAENKAAMLEGICQSGETCEHPFCPEHNPQPDLWEGHEL